MFWFILSIVSMLIFGILLLYSHKEERIWACNTPKYEDCGKTKCQLWVYLLAFIISFIPILNISLSITILIVYILQYKDGSSERYYIKGNIFSRINKLIIKTKEFLTKEI